MSEFDSNRQIDRLGPFVKAICAVRDRVAGFLGPFLKAIIII